MASIIRFDNWENSDGTQAGSIDASGNVTFDNDVTVSGGATVSGDLTVTGNMTSANQGLVFIKSQTIGSGVSSVTVTDAFSATFENYRVLISGVTATVNGSVPRLRLGSTSTGYYNSMLIVGYTGGTPSTLGVNNGDNWYLMTGSTSPSSMSVSIDIYQPNLATATTFTAHSTTNGSNNTTAGMLTGTTQYTSFIVIQDSGTISGGTISIYGYAQ